MKLQRLFLFLMMQFADRHFYTAEKIIISYDGTVPLHHYLKHFFAADKKYGSKDRKAISHACYCYYRLGNSLKDIPVADKIKAGVFLCTPEPGIWAFAFNEDWNANWNEDVQGKISFLQTVYSFEASQIFVLHGHLSSSIDKDSFIISHLVQPDLHIRIRPGRKAKVTDQLLSAGIQYDVCSDYCIALPNATKIDRLLNLNKDAVVQDLSSQRIAEFLQTANCQLPTSKVWDCCAASGGKSILAVDVLKNIELTVSDVRTSIIENLKKRFKEAGISHYHSFIADLSQPGFHTKTKYDLVICDAPCSGSGTWGRTPEQLSFFKEDRIKHYTDLQKKITTNVIPAIAANGHLLYITCSVFREENEEIVDFIQKNAGLQLEKTEVLKGYDKKADTMFAALFKASAV